MAYEFGIIDLMRFMFLFIATLLFFSVFVSGPVFAQNEDLDIVSEPICFEVRNEAEYSVTGSFQTDFYTRGDGIRARHRSNFRLQAAGSVDDETDLPSDRAEFCSYGPFLPDRKLSFTLRTLVPIFACQTRVDQGEIVIKGKRKPEGGTETWAECYL